MSQIIPTERDRYRAALSVSAPVMPANRSVAMIIGNSISGMPNSVLFPGGASFGTERGDMATRALSYCFPMGQGSDCAFGGRAIQKSIGSFRGLPLRHCVLRGS